MKNQEKPDNRPILARVFIPGFVTVGDSPRQIAQAEIAIKLWESSEFQSAPTTTEVGRPFEVRRVASA